MMMNIEQIVGLVVATVILGLSPGPAVFATIARAIKIPFLQTTLFIAGIVIADFVFAGLAMMGGALVVSQNFLLFQIIKCAGGGYLFYLGLSALVATFRSISISGGNTLFNDVVPESGFKLFISGFLLTASNPKDLLFFVSFLPAFVDLERIDIPTFILAATLISLSFIVTLTFYALIARRASSLLSGYGAALWLDRIAGVMLIAVGLIVLFF